MRLNFDFVYFTGTKKTVFQNIDQDLGKDRSELCGIRSRLTDELDGGGVAVDVDHDVEGRARVEAGEEDALVAAVDVEHNVTARREVETEEDALVDVALRQRFAPKSRPARQI